MSNKFVGGANMPPGRAEALESKVAFLRKCLGRLRNAIPIGTYLDLEADVAAEADECGKYVTFADRQREIALASQKKGE